MANTISSGLNNSIVAQSALDAFTDALTPLNAFSTSFNSDAAQKGSTIDVPFVATATEAVAFSSSYSMKDSVLNTKQISLDQHSYCSWYVTDTESANSSAVALSRFGAQKGFQLGKKVLQDVLSLITVANYGAPVFTGAASGFDGDDVADIRNAGIDNSIAPETASLVLDNAYHTALLKDTNLRGANVYGNTGIIQEGTIPRIFGLGGLYESNLVPDNSINLVGFLANPNAIVAAMRYLEPVGGGDYLAAHAVSDDSGMVLGYREWYDNDAGQLRAVIEASYGYAVGDANAAGIMVSS